MTPNTIRIGTRGSQLALWQAGWVKTAIEQHAPGVTVALDIIKTKGDKILDVPLAKVGGKGLFVKEIEEAILDGRIDLAVHSMKDMPAELPSGLAITAIPRRENPLDALVAHSCHSLEALPFGAVVGTSSLRRSAQLLRIRPDLHIEPLRGNLDTRLKKLDTAHLDAIVLAAAGLIRLGLSHRITSMLDHDTMLPAVGQGALCIESRENDAAIDALLEPLEDPSTRIAVTAERAFLERLEGGCQVPIAGHAVVADHQVSITGLVSDLDGRQIVSASTTGPCDHAAALGRQLAETLLGRGAGEILERLEHNAE
jgi:hydroxymethylbilane synthase